jgi:uncharacterized protein
MHLGLLMATLLALLAGPLIYSAARRQPRLLRAVDLVIVAGVGLLLLVDVIPDTFETGGRWSAAFLFAGLLGPTLLEHLLTHARREAHIAALLLAMIGLVLHSAADGTALAPAGGHGHASLGLAVALHSLPVGMLAWWLLYPQFGTVFPTLALLAMCAGTVAGYVFAEPLSSVLSTEGWAWLQALVAGSILHVLLGRPHLHADEEHSHL